MRPISDFFAQGPQSKKNVFSASCLKLHSIYFSMELLAQNQLILSLFIFYSVSENDAYFRPKVTYDFTDNWKAEIGGNIFTGEEETFFGQFRENSNIYAAIRYSFWEEKPSCKDLFWIFQFD